MAQHHAKTDKKISNCMCDCCLNRTICQSLSMACYRYAAWLKDVGPVVQRHRAWPEVPSRAVYDYLYREPC